jgi:hypothetical protein
VSAPDDPRPELSVSYHCFWEGFQGERSFLGRALARRFRVRTEEIGRDVQIYSVFRRPELASLPGTRPLRIWWSGEAREPSQAIFDLHFGSLPSSLLGERWQRLPVWLPNLDFDADGSHPRSVQRLLGPRRPGEGARFSNFLYSNPTSLRAEFFLRLNARRPVDSLGRLLPGTPEPVADKLAVLGRYRTTIAFESSLSPGYVTEKLVDPLLVGSVPIYWGADEARQDFNPRAFVFARDFATLEDLIDHVLALDDSREALAAMASEPAFAGNRLPYEHTPDFFAERIADALGRRLTAPVTEADNQRLQASEVISGRPVRRARWSRRLRGLFRRKQR